VIFKWECAVVCAGLWRPSCLRAWEGCEVIRDIRELRMISYIAKEATTDRSYANEARLRIDSLRGQNGPRSWQWTPAE
jgi:hypothetical protein